MKNQCVVVLSLLLFAASLLHSQQTQTRSASDYYDLALQAYKAKDYNAFVQNLKSVIQAGTTHPRVLYNLACGYALLHNTSESILWLNRIADLGIAYPIEKDGDLAFIRSTPEFREVAARFKQNEFPLRRSFSGFEIPDVRFVPEGITYDAATSKFYLGSILGKKIAMLQLKQEMKEFSGSADGLWTVLGMSIDPERKVLWVSSSTLEELDGGKKPQSGVFKYDLQSGKLIQKYLLPTDEGHQLGDVIVNKNGDAFTSDSLNPGLYKITRSTNQLEKLPFDGLFRSPQGLCFSNDEKRLFVADYVRGIFVIDPNTNSHQKLEGPPNSTVAGIDGLYQYNGELIATQNGFSPNRILRISLNSQQNAINKVEVLESNTPDRGEITLGTIVGDDLYYIANSQLQMYLENRNAKLQPAAIRKIHLAK